MNRYVDFWQATEDALVFATQQLKLELTPQARRALMQAYLELPVWPDVPPALRTLREMGVRLAFLSNATPTILNAGIRNADPRAYAMGPKAFEPRSMKSVSSPSPAGTPRGPRALVIAPSGSIA